MDSYAGETIQPVGPTFALGEDGRPVLRTEVDPRYGDSVLMLRLDGSVLSRSAWGTIGGLENGVGGEAVRVRDLADRRGAGS